jgi:hypothetical protein
VLESGGDGEILIGFLDQNIEEVAKEFRNYLPESWLRVDVKDGTISFYDQQESITIAPGDIFSELKTFGTRILTY